MEYKLRELRTGDIFKMSRILRKMNLKLDFNDKSQDQMGGELILAIAGSLDLAEDEISEFIADLSGITAEEFKALPISESIKLINEFKAITGLKGFFEQAGRLTK